MAYEWDTARARRANMIRMALVIVAALLLAGLPTVIVITAMGL